MEDLAEKKLAKLREIAKLDPAKVPCFREAIF